jgi:hypothetical protein
MKLLNDHHLEFLQAGSLTCAYYSIGLLMALRTGSSNDTIQYWVNGFDNNCS